MFGRKKKEEKEVEDIKESIQIMDVLAMHFEQARQDINKALQRQVEIVELRKENKIMAQENEHYRKQLLKMGWDEFEGRTNERNKNRD